MPRAILLAQMVPGNSASAIYIYDRERRDFHMLSFEGTGDPLTVEDFFQLLTEYNLLDYAEKP